jgi:hypothetical protein
MAAALVEELEHTESVRATRADGVTLDQFATEKYPNGNTIIHGAGTSGFLIFGTYTGPPCSKIPSGQRLALRVALA